MSQQDPPPPPPPSSSTRPSPTPQPPSSTPQQPPPQPSKRRVPPPCWSHEETSALIDAYHEKWYTLRRGNLKASHWQDVADSVAVRCNLTTPSKTSVQCRHKIEKLRKRYRTEKQRALTIPNRRFSSSWVYFKKMDFMEKGPSSTTAVDDDDDEDPNDEDEGEDEDAEVEEEEEEEERNGGFARFDLVDDQRRSYHQLGTNGSGGFRFRIPGSGSGSSRSVANARASEIAKPSKGYGRFEEIATKSSKGYGRFDEIGVKASKGGGSYGRFDEIPIAKAVGYNGLGNGSSNPSGMFMNGSWGKGSNERNERKSNGSGSRGKREMDPVAEMVSSIRLLGEGFVRMEQMKIDMAREMEQMRMEMEMKRTEMILESQERIIDAFAKGFGSKKKVKRMPSPNS